MSRFGTGKGTARRVALLLVALALLLRIPAGWMPEARADGVVLGWCSGASHAAPAAARALIDAALPQSGAPEHKPAPDQPCPFAAAAQPLAAADPVATIFAPAPVQALALVAPPHIPGRGLAAPPPRSTGPPLLA